MAKDFDQGAKMRRWKTNLERPEKALKQIGIMMVAESRGAFKKQRFGSERWSARGTPNVFAIISDFHAGKKTPPKRRFEDRPAMRDTGLLMRSITYAVSGDTVTVGTVVHYADVLHDGGAIKSKTINQLVQRLLHAWLKGKGRKWRGDLGYLLNKSYLDTELEGTVEARPFVGITARTLTNAQKIVGTRIMEVE